MMHEPSTAPEPQGWDPEEEDHSPCPQDHGDEEYLAGQDAASMEGAISKFMEGLEGQEHSGFPQIHRLLSRLPVPVQKKTRSMTHTEAIEGVCTQTGIYQSVYRLLQWPQYGSCYAFSSAQAQEGAKGVCESVESHCVPALPDPP